jgi:hypothetical protein
MPTNPRPPIATGIAALGLSVLFALTGCTPPGSADQATSPSASSSNNDPFATTMQLAATDTVDIGDYGGGTDEGVQVQVSVLNTAGEVVSCLDFSGCGSGVEFGVLTATLQGEPGGVARQPIYSGGSGGFGFNFGQPGVTDITPVAPDHLQRGQTSFTLPHDIRGGTSLTFDIEFEPADGNPYLRSSATISFTVPVVALSITDLRADMVIDHGKSALYVEASLDPFNRDDERCPLGTWHFSVSNKDGLVVAEQDLASNDQLPRAGVTFGAIPAGTYSIQASFEPAEADFGRYSATETASVSYTVAK